MKNTREIGIQYEEQAAALLKEKEYEILERNFGCKMGEIDIIAKHQGYLVFVEVKYRKDAAFGMPQEAVTKSKQRKISNTASYYMRKKNISQDVLCRFDVVAITGTRAEIIQNAFEYSGFFAT